MDWLARVPLIPERAEATTTTPVPLRTLIDVEGVEGQRSSRRMPPYDLRMTLLSPVDCRQSVSCAIYRVPDWLLAWIFFVSQDAYFSEYWQT